MTSLEDAKASLLSQQNSTGKGKNKVLDMLMAATKKGGPLQNVGLRGRLGDLGTIDPEYDVAIRYKYFIIQVLGVFLFYYVNNYVYLISYTLVMCMYTHDENGYTFSSLVYTLIFMPLYDHILKVKPNPNNYSNSYSCDIIFLHNQLVPAVVCWIIW